MIKFDIPGIAPDLIRKLAGNQCRDAGLHELTEVSLPGFDEYQIPDLAIKFEIPGNAPDLIRKLAYKVAMPGYTNSLKSRCRDPVNVWFLTL